MMHKSTRKVFDKRTLLRDEIIIFRSSVTIPTVLFALYFNHTLKNYLLHYLIIAKLKFRYFGYVYIINTSSN